MPNPLFRLGTTEERLFGPSSEPVPTPRWRQYPETEDAEAAMPKVRTRLSAQQERTLFLRYNYARYRLSRLMAAQSRRFAPRRVSEILLWYRRALETRAALVGANMALVVAMAKRTRINAVEFGELVSEGNMALLRAVEKFDVARGFKFSTYACRAILKAFNRLATKSGTYRQHFPTEFEPEMERSDEIERRHKDQRELAIEDLQRVLAMNMADLTEVERTVVGARFAVAGHRQVKTLEQVGRLVGLSKERVRQVQNDALAKLRAAIEAQTA
jgi:RNA polymerase sigma factor (sigma-70 family)